MPQAEPSWPETVSLAVHEMRSPLNVVSGFLGLLLDNHGGTLTPVQRQAVESAEASVAQVNDLLNALSELARLESGRLVATEDRVAVADLLREAAARFVAPLDLSIRCLVTGDVPDARVAVDHQRLPRALASMAMFVARSTPTTPAVIVRARLRGDHVAVTFTDAATDLAPTDLDDLAPLPESHGGLGLGLPLARALVAHAGGRAGVPRGGAATGQLALLLPLR
jgi:signal transduction histidine kinase